VPQIVNTSITLNHVQRVGIVSSAALGKCPRKETVMTKTSKCRSHYLLKGPLGITPIQRGKIAQHATGCKPCRREWRHFLMQERATVLGSLITTLQFVANDKQEEQAFEADGVFIPWKQGLEVLWKEAVDNGESFEKIGEALLKGHKDDPTCLFTVLVDSST